MHNRFSDPHLQSIIARQFKIISNHINLLDNTCIEDVGKNILLRSLPLDSLGAPKRIARLNALHKSCRKRSEVASTQTPSTPSIRSGMAKTYNASSSFTG